MVVEIRIKVVKLKDIPVGNKCLLLPDPKNGIDSFNRSLIPPVVRSELKTKNNQEYMVTRVYGGRVSFSGNTAVIDMGEKES